MNRSLPPLTLDQLSALNDEILALTRAGVPLELGLRELGRDMPGRLGEAARILGSRLEAGESLDQVLATSGGLPPAYAAVVEAGLRSGRLASALNSVASTMRRVADLRRIFLTSLVYPLIVLTLAYVLLLVTLDNFDNASLEVFRSLETTANLPVHWVTTLKRTMRYWVAIPPLLVAVGVIITVLRYRSAPAAPAMHRYWLPSIRRMIRDGRLYAFLEVLTLLVEHDTPLDKAIQLSAAASGDASLARVGEQMANRIRSGQPLEGLESVPRDLPPLLGWLLLSGRQQIHLVQSLRRMSSSYAARAQRTAAFLSVYLPLLVSGVVGGSATLIYAIIALGPWYYLLYRLGTGP